MPGSKIPSRFLNTPAGTNFSSQQIASGSSATVSSGNSKVYVNPASLLASLALTMPASPNDQDEVWFFFGGTIAGGNAVVTALTISGNTGQSLLQAITPQAANGGDVIGYSYNSNNQTWYRIN